MTKKQNASLKIVRSTNNPAPAKRGRGRPREFDREWALDQAMKLFWKRGYETTSMAELRAVLRITQASLYAAFGSKEQLFRDVVDLYLRTANASTAQALAGGATAREAIHSMMQAAVDAFSAPGTPGGCLLILGATNCAVENKGIQDHLVSIRRQIARSISERLKRGQRDGDVPAGAPLSALTAYYSTVLQGLAFQSRDGASQKTLTDVVHLAMANWQQAIRSKSES